MESSDSKRRNYVLDSNKTLTGGNSAVSTTFNYSFQNNLNQLRGKTVTLSVDVELVNGRAGVHDRNRLGFEPSIRYSDGTTQYLGLWYRLSEGANFKGRISRTFTIQNKPIASMNQRGMYIQVGGSVAKLSNPKFEINNTATEYSTAPEDTKNIVRNYRVNRDGTYTFQAKDNAGNTRNASITVKVEDHISPKGTITASPTGWTNQSVQLSFIGTDEGGSGVKRVRRPNGTWVYGSTTTQTVTTNGTYIFVVEDHAGNQTSVAYEVWNIDHTNPTAVITSDPSGWTNQDVTLTIKATDHQSGVRRVQIPGGKWINGDTGTYIAKGNSTYSFRVEDNAGNVRIFTYLVNNIDRASPSETTIEIKPK